ncbi:hypothetical protein C1X69_27170 [Pseudomonas sp. FW305-67]|nr:hypothetical protein C1X70_29815 [Pseudomonas sp. FW305-53]PMY83398.1 hypothetical protein C1X68_29880 [Pseudomonas sp. FW303-C2]PNA38165.1 hypothetical protein C1X71_29935 [Pseudomonas sp. FW306-2-2C-A10BC]PNA80143.1 hypothetical protein C1X66_29940 [Pseudomonas sp. MPR-R3B]PNB12368.1 hypothetical protein C1X69_27170 [Pseudomonas sp. FW305-67]
MLGLGGRRRDKPQMRQSPHLAGFVVFGLVGRGNLNLFCKLLIYNIYNYFYFLLEYQLEYCTPHDHPFAFDPTRTLRNRDWQ